MLGKVGGPSPIILNFKNFFLLEVFYLSIRPRLGNSFFFVFINYRLAGALVYLSQWLALVSVCAVPRRTGPW